MPCICVCAWLACLLYLKAKSTVEIHWHQKASNALFQVDLVRFLIVFYALTCDDVHQNEMDAVMLTLQYRENTNTLTTPFENPMVFFKLVDCRRPFGWIVPIGCR